MVSRTVGDGPTTCIAQLGDCAAPGPDCNGRCQSIFPGGFGSCDSSFPPQCICRYNCPGPMPPKPHRCTNNNGGCSREECGDQCCDFGCKRKYPGPDTIGTCETAPGTLLSLCLCTYTCSGPPGNHKTAVSPARV
ncbi:hypothetical protein RND81_01G209800 [Saponaria officinalis]|uniref:Defensin-like protein n=1 Tax=Saponaria officinalis TaxID=3572 RepID=A0AAW1NK06_SAPOF